MRITHTINLLEVIWTAIAFVGLLYKVLLFVRSYKDRKWLIDGKVNGDRHTREYVATTGVLMLVGGLSVQTAFVVVGVVSMTVPNFNNAMYPTTQGIINAGAFIAASLINTIMAGVIYNRRVRVVRLVVEEYIRRDHA